MLKHENDEKTAVKPNRDYKPVPSGDGIKTQTKTHLPCSSLADEIASRTFQDPAICYQCGKCSAGCPVRYYMDVAPNKIVRLVQLGFYEEALSSSAPWLCAGCMACSTRCPNNFDLAAFMDALRNIAVERGIRVSEKNIMKFHEAFLDQIRMHGRSYEAGLVAEYKFKTLNLLQDAESAGDLLAKGKLSIIPHRVKDKKMLKRIFGKTKNNAVNSNSE